MLADGAAGKAGPPASPLFLSYRALEILRAEADRQPSDVGTRCEARLSGFGRHGIVRSCRPQLIYQCKSAAMPVISDRPGGAVWVKFDCNPDRCRYRDPGNDIWSRADPAVAR